MTTAVAGRDALPSQAEVMAQAGTENFPVASVVLGPRRRHLMAIYGFARLVDDVGDEVTADRTELLNHIEAELQGIYNGVPPQHAVMVTLADTIKACDLPADPFMRLVEANRRDQVVTRYETFDQLLEYCQLSATPVGELVLHVFGAATPARIALSDQICAALQIIEHLQDVSEDYLRGRVYLPQEDMERFSCTGAELRAPMQYATTRALIESQAARARRMLAEGAPLARTLKGRERLAVAGFVAGGRTALRGLERAAHGRAHTSGRGHKISFAAQLPRAVMGR
jgi:squalene synthase HpnC